MISDARQHDFDTALELLNGGDPDAAIEVLRAPKAPHEREACVLLAKAWFQRGDARGDVFSSHFFAERAIELGDTSHEVLAILGIASFRKEQYREASAIFARFVGEDSLPATQFMYGMALLYNEQAADAAIWIRRVAEKEPGNDMFQQGLQSVEAALQDHTVAATDGVTSPDHPPGLGGVRDTRALDEASPYPYNPISKLLGHANQPKDFDWLEKNIPCQRGCPAKTDIPGYLSAIYRGEYDEAYRINLRDNVFPAVLGRVCSRPCENECRHGWPDLGASVAICFSKRSAADFKTKGLVIMEPWYDKTGKKVAVIGAGPGGLAAARNLALLGHAVTVYERHKIPGGMMNQGIPEFRLPRGHIDQEIEQIRQLGVEVVCETNIGTDITMDQLVSDFDAVVMAAGTLRPNILKLPGGDLKGIHHGLPWLLEANVRDDAPIGDNVVVIGGGFTAMDCARTARRLGANAMQLESEGGGEWSVAQSMTLKGENIRVSYRRSRNEMLVTPGEVEELKHEGIPMEYYVSPLEYVGKEGHVTHMRFIKTELGEPDESGRCRPVDIPGSEFDVEADTILLATGQFPQTDWIEGELRKQLVEEDEWLKSGTSPNTAVSKVFAAGDFATGASTLIEAIAHGKDCARSVDTFLMGEERLVDIAVVEDANATDRIREMDEVALNPMPMLDLAKRTLAGEVEQGFPVDSSVDETQRCYFCHYKYEIDHDKCIYCDWCIKAKPRPNCIVKIKDVEVAEDGRITGWQEARNSEETKLIWINQEDCIRCNACVDACPVDCISIQKVSRQTVRSCDSCASTALSSLSLPT